MPKKEDRMPIVAAETEIDDFPPENSGYYLPQNIPEAENPEIIDNYNFVYFSFGLLGTVMLLPMNVIVTATNFWMYKFRTINDSIPYNPDDDTNRNDLQTFFESNIAIYNNLFFLITLLVNIYLGHLIRPKVRIYFSMLMTFLGLCAITWFTLVNTDSYQPAFFSIIMGLVIVLSISSAIFQSTMLGIMSLFPGSYMSITIVAQAFSGILAAGLQLLTLIQKMEPQKSAFYFFFFTDIIVVLTVICIIFMRKQRFYKYYSKMAQNANSDEVSRQSMNGDNLAAYHPESDSALRFVLHKNRIYFISIILLTWATLCVYPPLTILIVARDPHISAWDGRFFTTVVCFCLFNISDMVGRIVASQIPTSERKSPLLLFVSILRWALVPMLMLCNAQPRAHLPVYFGNESFVVLFVLMLGLTNGYLVMACIANTSKDLPLQLHEMNGFMLTLTFGVSVVLGSLTSNLILHLI